jgi:hypothetical protein
MHRAIVLTISKPPDLPSSNTHAACGGKNDRRITHAMSAIVDRWHRLAHSLANLCGMGLAVRSARELVLQPRALIMQEDRLIRIALILSITLAACSAREKKPDHAADATSGTGTGGSAPPAMQMQHGAGGAQGSVSMPTGDASTVQTGGPADAAVHAGNDASHHDPMSGGTDAGSQASIDPLCANQSGHCVKVCEGGVCNCHCDCHSTAECGMRATPFVCTASDDPIPPCCGTGQQCGPTRPCTAFGADFVCSVGPCASCVPPCPNDEYCGEGYRCGDDKLCVFKRCDSDGFACPARSHCDATNTASDVHGCLHDACSSDTDCTPGACVNGRCHDAPGSCRPTLCA